MTPRHTETRKEFPVNKYEPFLQDIQDILNDMQWQINRQELTADSTYPDYEFLEDLFALRRHIQNEIGEIIAEWIKRLGKKGRKDPLTEEEARFGEVVAIENKRLNTDDHSIDGLISLMFSSCAHK